MGVHSPLYRFLKDILVAIGQGVSAICYEVLPRSEIIEFPLSAKLE
jgi:hypothetical protein